MSRNKNMHAAKKAKNDEFYTRYEDIEKEVENYKDQLKGMIIFCNADDYRVSNFVKFFKDKFVEYGLKELHSMNIDNGNGAYHYCYDGVNETVVQVPSGSFDSDESVTILKKCDAVITNPPFSLARDYLKVLMENIEE